MKFYSLKNILAKNANYNIIFGERSNGKTYAVLLYALEQYIKTGNQLGLIRRWKDDFTGKRGVVMFDSLVANKEISKLTKGKWDNVYYQASKWYLCRFEDDKRICDDTPFCYGFAISGMEHDKSTSYPKVNTILFDEFITRGVYLPDEFVLFMNCLSTIIRQRSDVKIFMLGNTVNKYCPYFAEMGLVHIKDMQQGTIDVYQYGNSKLTVAVEFTAPTKKGKASDFYFAFDNPKLNMITGGTWELDIYPHCPHKYKPKNILLTFFIKFGLDVLQAEVVNVDNLLFIFIFPKTTEIKDNNAIIYSLEHSPQPNHYNYLTKGIDKLSKRIATLFNSNKIFYSDNNVGEIIRNYINAS